MIDSIVWTPTTGSAQTMNTDDDNYPVSEFDVIPDVRLDNSRQKPGAHGVFATPTMRDGMSIDITLGILASSPTGYNNNRLQLMSRLFGENYDGQVTEDSMGTLAVQLTGQEETWNADCAISAITGPKSASEGAYSEVMVTFYSFVAYFYGGTDPTNFYRYT